MIIVLFLALLGAAFGSFVGALVWRIHEGKDMLTDRSECEHCHHKLGFWDLLPIASWLMLAGKCRYCSAAIGKSAIGLEVLMLALFAASFLVWPYSLNNWQDWAVFGLWLAYLVGLVALLVYDIRWMQLPNNIVFTLVGLGVVELIVRYLAMPGADAVSYVFQAVLGVAALAGVYFVLYAVSGGRWVGFGDVKLGIFMGIALGGQRALLALFLANVIGFVVVLPGLLMGKLKRTSRVPFGPFLIAAFLIAYLFGDKIIGWYLHSILTL